jgi:type VI protein secretion system component VasK
MENEASNMKRAGTGKSVIMYLLVVIVAIAAIAAVCLIPGVAENILWAILIIIAAILIIAVIFYVFVAILAVPFYLAKGEGYQGSGSYKVDDVKPVKEKNSDEKKGV